MTDSEQERHPKESSAAISASDCLQLAAETELFLSAVTNVPLNDSAKQSWLLLRLAHEELVTKMLKLERETSDQVRSRQELEQAYHAVRQAKWMFLQKYKERA